MTLTRTRYEVAYVKGDEIVETEIEVWAVDEMKAELEGRRHGIRGPVVDTNGTTVTDLGDARNADALKVWAALVRTGAYDGKSVQFRTEHCVGIAKVKTPNELTTDPTRPGVSTDSA